MDRLKDIFALFFAAVGAFAFLCAVYQAMNDRVASAGVLGGLTLLAAAMFYFPQLEVLKAFSIELRMRQTLDRAEELIGRLKDLSASSARVAYLTIAWGNRMGTPSAVEKQEILDDVDAQLVSLKITDRERKTITKPLVQLIGVDLWQSYVQVLDRFMQGRQQQLLAAATTTSASTEAKSAMEEFQKQYADYNSSRARSPYRDREDYSLRDHLRQATPIAAMSVQQRESAAFFQKQLVDIFEGCQSKGGYTPDAIAYFDGMSGNEIGAAEKKSIELFGLGFN